MRPTVSVNWLEIQDRLLSSFLLWSRLFLTASDHLLLSASSGRLLLSAPSGHPLDRLDLDTYVLLHRVRESELNPMFFASLPGYGSILECCCLVILWLVSTPRAYVPLHRVREIGLNPTTYVPLHQRREPSIPQPGAPQSSFVVLFSFFLFFEFL